MRTWLLLAMTLLEMNCDAKVEVKGLTAPRWKPQRATQLQVGGFTVAIPAHWRDARELVKPLATNVPEDMFALFPDDESDLNGVSAEIVVSRVNVVKGDDCAHIAERMKGDVRIFDGEAATFDGDPGCTMKIQVGDTAGKLVVRTHGDHAVFVRCLGGGNDLDTACEAVVYGLKPTGAST